MSLSHGCSSPKRTVWHSLLLQSFMLGQSISETVSEFWGILLPVLASFQKGFHVGFADYANCRCPHHVAWSQKRSDERAGRGGLDSANKY